MGNRNNGKSLDRIERARNPIDRIPRRLIIKRVAPINVTKASESLCPDREKAMRTAGLQA